MIARLLSLALAFLLLAAPRADAADDLGLKVAPGFRVTLYADHELANDIYAMTLDSEGRVVVTSRGWVKRLEDTKGTGKADRAVLLAKTATGGMGMCFDGDDLYFVGDGHFSVYRDCTGKTVAEQPDKHFLPIRFGEHGGHAIRKGPDGCWYLIGGNDSGFGDKQTRKKMATSSPIKNVEGGALLRFKPNLESYEVVAHGFRNPYDFDFNAAGDIFTYDSDMEGDYFLPWYTPTRIYHVAPGMHHGWRLPGWQRSWARPSYYPDTVDVLWPVGRGSPTGVACYRHRQFPPHYRGGLFALDWTFGKVYFFPLTPNGTTYHGRPEVFIEPVGSNGFAPTDVCVAPDGSLFISIGGRGTRGAVYKVEYVGDGKTPPDPRPEPASDLDAVLEAPQPLEAWSRARWVPRTESSVVKTTAGLSGTILDPSESVDRRIRAIEVYTELYYGVTCSIAREAAKSDSSGVRERIAWSLGRAVPRVEREGWGKIMLGLAGGSWSVQVRKMEVIYDLVNDPRSRALLELPPDWKEMLTPSLVTALGSNEKRLRQAAARLATLWDDQDWIKLRRAAQKAGPQAHLSLLLADCLPGGTIGEGTRLDLLSILEHTDDPKLRLQAVRLLMLTWGDYRLHDPPAEVYTGYTLASPPDSHSAFARYTRRVVRGLFPSVDPLLDREASRLLAMLEDDDPATAAKMIARWTKESSPTDDIHYLIVLSRLKAPRTEEQTKPVADAILTLDRKLKGQQQRPYQNWSLRLAEVVANLLKQHPGLADAMLQHPEFVNPAHVLLAARFDPEHRRQAAKRFLEVVRKDPDFAWSGQLIDLLGLLPPEETRPVFRAPWGNFGLRDALLLQLAKNPDPADRERFLTGLESVQQNVVLAALAALEKLPPDKSPERLVPLLKLLRRAVREPNERAVRAQVLVLLNRQAGTRFAATEKLIDPASLAKAYRPVFDWFTKAHPKLAPQVHGGGGEDGARLLKRLKEVPWQRGDAVRGEAIFRASACATCHGGSSRVGPDLAGAAERFSREDLFAAIIDPGREVAPPYRVTQVETEDGRRVSGIVVFESADGVILQTGAAETLRLGTSEIASRRPSDRSLMPDGLLKDLKPEEFADLYAYLQTLKRGGK